ncbi:probable thiopurine S-methyltransferase isoform X2 [Acanthaster planci]|uniref:thiopurine S-methyltransferase n=1 Tax=Acanthaster planci TaxID=133434 RepID=A0A8B7Y8D0_ACAPL|nr:probable thiopurine S-methyltransferase isoform X2 [Acanthaster planci]
MAKVVDDEYWKRLWVEDNIGFHRSEVHPGLLKYIAEMTAGQEKCKIFVPLCGKSEDLKWLADRGHTVVGVELATLAIEAFFKENELDFTTSHVEGLSDADLYKSQDDSIFIYKADIFDLNKDIMGEFDCIWDRASLVALPRQDIQRYADLMRSILKSKGRCLLETVEYDQSKMNGPPFSTAVQTVEQLYASDWDIKPLEMSDWTNDMWRRAGLDVISGRIALLTRKR